ncbi:MAG: hypothetical protein ACREL1_07840 [bacterium]
MTKLKTLLATVAIFMAGASVWADANFSITGYGQYSRRILNANTPFASNGLGGTLLFEVEPISLFSLGVGYQMTDYIGINGPGEGVAAVEVTGRVFLIPDQAFSPYLMGTFGLNPFGTNAAHLWPDTNNFSAGAGIRYFVTPHWAADFGASFQDFKTQASALQSIDIHTGLSFFVDSPFNHADKIAWAGNGVTITEPVTIMESGRDVQTLADIAEDEYGDSDLYPLIIDANFTDKSNPLILPPGSQLIIPQNPTPAMIADAHAKAKRRDYEMAAKTFHMPEQNAEYRLEPPRVSEGLPTRSRKSLTFQSDSLWDIAARPDVYGDPELYPLLVDANFNSLTDPLVLKPGAKLIIPRHATQHQKQMARIKAWSAEYIQWRGVDVTQDQYRKWRKEKGLPPVDEATGEVLTSDDSDSGE